MKNGKENFLLKAKEKFPKLLLEKVVWVRATDPVTIECPEHGEFTISPNALLHKNCKGCPTCVKTTKARKRAEDFIKKAKDVHGSTYNYSKVTEINNMHDAVVIECSMHGEFKQTARNHLKGSICHSCMNIERGYKQRYNRLGRQATLYFVYFEDYDLYKIGVTVNLSTRFNGEPCKPNILFSKTYEHEAEAYLIETQLFHEYYSFKYKGTPVLSRKGNSELITSDISDKLILSVETIESTEEFRTLTGSE